MTGHPFGRRFDTLEHKEADMEPNAIKHADDKNFETLVLTSPRPVLVDFWAPWCGPCKAIAPVLEELAQSYGDKLDVVKVNVDDSRATATKYGIRSIPTLIIIRDGQVLGTRTGAMPKTQLTTFIDEHIR
jgi:thioredoxin 1